MFPVLTDLRSFDWVTVFIPRVFRLIIEDYVRFFSPLATSISEFSNSWGTTPALSDLGMKSTPLRFCSVH